MSDMEHMRSGIVRVNGNAGPNGTCISWRNHWAARVIKGPSWTALVTRVGANERGRRTSFKTEIKLSSFARARPGASFEEPRQARLVKIAHGRLAAWLDPFGMLPSQVVVDLSLKLSHGVGRVTD